MISSGWLTMKVLRVAAKSARRWFCVRRPEKRWRSRDNADRFRSWKLIYKNIYLLTSVMAISECASSEQKTVGKVAGMEC